MKNVPGYDSKDRRFVCSLQNNKDETLYHDFHETDKLAEAKQRAEDEGKKVNRAAIVFDREAPGLVFKWEPEKKEEVVQIPKVESRPSRKVKRK